MPVTHSLSLACHTFLECLPGLVPIGSEVKRQSINVTLTLTHFNGRQQSSQRVSRRQQRCRGDWLHRGLRVKPLWLMNVLLQPGSVLTLCQTIESLLVSSLRVGSIISILGMKKGGEKGDSIQNGLRRGSGWLGRRD